ncbi:GNAT family N-acetyltransferase [Salmonella enterica]|nr:GNAT family N-acetyltransferase [Salmonella enterica]
MEISCLENDKENFSTFLMNKLDEFNSQFINTDNIELCLFIKNGNDCLKGGLYGEKYGKVLYIKYLWVDLSLRGSGSGRKLLKNAEEWGVNHDCSIVILDTYEFQAPGFYKSLGYLQFGHTTIGEKEITRFYFHKKIQK